MSEIIQLNLTESDRDILGFALMIAVRDQRQKMERAMNSRSENADDQINGCRQRMGRMQYMQAKLDLS